MFAIAAWASACATVQQRVEAAPLDWIEDLSGTPTLVLSDDFNGDSLDRSRWCTRYQYSGGPPVPDAAPGCIKFGVYGTLDFLNQEQQRYVDTNRDGKRLHQVRDGVLHLMATRSRADEQVMFESAMIRSKAEFRPDADKSYVMLARLRLPDVKGTWPAFWISPGVDDNRRTASPPEIDFMEGAFNGSSDPANTLQLGVQPHNWGGKGFAGTRNPPSFAVAEYDKSGRYRAPRSMRGVWLEFAGYWTDSRVCIYIDRRKVSCHDYRWIDNDGKLAPPGPILLNLAVGGSWAGRDGIDLNRFPVSFDVDYVKVYEIRKPAKDRPEPEQAVPGIRR